MWLEIKQFFTNWLGGSIDVPIPFTNGTTIDLIDLVGLVVLFFIIFWVLLTIKRLIDSIISMFQKGCE